MTLSSFGGPGIALLILNKASSRTPLPIAHFVNSVPCLDRYDTCKARALGWGETHFGGSLVRARGVSFSTISNTCKDIDLGDESNAANKVECAEQGNDWTVDSCLADSGGPLIRYRRQLGVISSGDECGKAEEPGYFIHLVHSIHNIEGEIDRIEDETQPDAPETQPDAPETEPDAPGAADDAVANGFSAYHGLWTALVGAYLMSSM